MALVGLTVDTHRRDEKVERIADLPEVTWSAVVAGRYDILTEVVTEGGVGGLHDFLNLPPRAVGGINSSEMSVAMQSRRRRILSRAALRRSRSAGVPGDG